MSLRCKVVVVRVVDRQVATMVVEHGDFEIRRFPEWHFTFAVVVPWAGGEGVRKIRAGLYDGVVYCRN